MKSALKLVEKEVSIKAQWGRIAALTWGKSTNPPVLLCHGKLDVCSAFRPLVSLLPTSFYYVSLDLPGNGRSDHFVKGARYTVVDFVPTIERVQEHFKWKEFALIGHSLGAIVGKYFDLAYPGIITRMVEIDPLPAYQTWELDSFRSWYQYFYKDYYDEVKFRKFNAGAETAPKYTYEKAADIIMNARGLDRQTAEHILERSLEPAGDGLYRFTYDQRQKKIPRLPFSSQHLRELYTSTTTPRLTFLASQEMHWYKNTPFIKDPAAWGNNDYRVKVVEGNHDVHVNTPECLAGDISKFLMEDFKAKL